MPDRSTLRPGDSIKLLFVPDADLQQRDRQRLQDQEDDWIPTATVLEEIISKDCILTIDHIDEYGYPWFEYKEHSIAIMDNDSWEIVSNKPYS